MDVSENSPESSTAFGFHDVDCWAVTYPNPSMSTIKFRWSIRNFLHLYDTSNEIKSGSFEGQFEGLGGIGNQWQIRLRKQVGPNTGREFLSVHLYLSSINQDNPLRPDAIPARFQVCVLESNGSIFRKAGEDDSKFHIFQKRHGWGFNNFCLVEHLRTQPERLLPNGELLLTCKIQIEKPHISVEGRGGVRNEGHNVTKSTVQLSNDFNNLLCGGIGSDFTIILADNQTKFAVHKVMLAARSEVFKAMLTFPGNKEESLTIKDFDFNAVAVMLEYIYTGVVDQKVLRENAPDILQIADYYILDELRSRCESAMAENMDVENAMDVLVFADKYNCNWLKQVTVHFITCNRKAVMDTSAFKETCEAHPNLIVDLYLS